MTETTSDGAWTEAGNGVSLPDPTWLADSLPEVPAQPPEVPGWNPSQYDVLADQLEALSVQVARLDERFQEAVDSIARIQGLVEPALTSLQESPIMRMLGVKRG